MADFFPPCALRTSHQNKISQFSCLSSIAFIPHSNSLSHWASYSNHAGGGTASEKEPCKSKVKVCKIPSLRVGKPALDLVLYFFKVIHLLMVPLSQFPHLQIKQHMKLDFSYVLVYIFLSYKSNSWIFPSEIINIARKTSV